MVQTFVREKAKSLIKDKKVRLLGFGKYRIHFSVQSSSLHALFFDKTTCQWQCSCPYFTLKKNICSHIQACQQYLRNILDVIE